MKIKPAEWLRLAPADRYILICQATMKGVK